jgi:hypothetical protein
MLERLKVLSGALRLKEFSVRDLARYSEVNEHTVRTVLDRRNDLFEELRRDKTGRPGGSLIVYSLRPDRVKSLEKELDEIYGSLPTVDRAAHEAPVLLALDVADEFLTRHFHATEDSERRDEIIAIATKQMDSVRSDLESTDVFAPATIEKIKQRLAKLDASRATCVQLTDNQRRMARMAHELVAAAKMVDEVKPAPAYAVFASRREPAFAGALLQGCNMVMVDTVASTVVDTIRTVSDREHAHFIDVPIGDAEKITQAEIIKVIDGVKSSGPSGLTELIFSGDSGKHSRSSLLSTLTQVADAISALGILVPLIFFDKNYDPMLRNALLGGRANYAGNAEELDATAVLEVMRKCLLEQRLTRLVASGVDGFQGGQRSGIALFSHTGLKT